jgi:hypothetical protein
MGTDAGAVNCAALPVVSLDFCTLLHSLALCPCPPQYRHKPCAIRQSHSVCVNPPCAVRWRVTGGLLGGPWAADIAEVAGAPDTALCVLGTGVPRLVLVPGFGRVRNYICSHAPSIRDTCLCMFVFLYFHSNVNNTYYSIRRSTEKQQPLHLFTLCPPTWYTHSEQKLD